MKITARFITAAFALSVLLFCGCLNPWFSDDRAIHHYVNALSLDAADLHDDAVQELQAAVKVDQEFSLAYSMLGDLYRQQGRYEQAAGAYEFACRLDPWAFNDHLNLGQVYQLLKQFVRALEVLKRACLLKPENVTANYSLGVCYYETGDYEQGKNHRLWRL